MKIGREAPWPEIKVPQPRPEDVALQRQQLLRWWSQPGKWQNWFALQGRRKLSGWKGSEPGDAEGARWWMAETFKKAELYWVSPEMTEVIMGLAPSIPDCLPQPPVEDALVVFAESVPGTDSDTGRQIFTSAILWGTINMYGIGPCVSAETYAWREMVMAYDGLDEKERERFRQAYPNRLMPTGGWEWPLESMTTDFSGAIGEGDTETMETYHWLRQCAPTIQRCEYSRPLCSPSAEW